MLPCMERRLDETLFDMRPLRPLLLEIAGELGRELMSVALSPVGKTRGSGTDAGVCAAGAAVSTSEGGEGGGENPTREPLSEPKLHFAEPKLECGLIASALPCVVSPSPAPRSCVDDEDDVDARQVCLPNNR